MILLIRAIEHRGCTEESVDYALFVQSETRVLITHRGTVRFITEGTG